MNSSVIAFLALAGAFAVSMLPAAAADADKPQYYELRVYTTKSAEQQKLVSDYWQNAAGAGLQPHGHLARRRFH